MKLLLIHSDGFSWRSKEKALKTAEPLDKDQKNYSTKESVLVTFIGIEKGDNNNLPSIIDQAVTEIKQALDDVSEKNLILYPWVHLSDTPAEPKEALQIIKELHERLEKELTDYHIHRSPFGYYKAFSINCKGHPLAERSKSIHGKKAEKEQKISEHESDIAIKAEESTVSQFYIWSPDNKLTPYEDFNYQDRDDLRLFVNYETKKDRTAPHAPEHVKYLKALELVDYEEGSDAGNFRILPKGYTLKHLIEEHVTNMALNVGSFIIETPLIYDYNHESLKKYLERFPARQYKVISGSNTYFMRFAACFGQFLTLSDATISYKNLPLKMFELAKSYRREQRGELGGLRRLRAFTMPDMHTVAPDLTVAKEAFEEQFELAMQYMEDIDVSYEAAFRMTNDFYEENKEWLNKLFNRLGKPLLLELFNKRYAYFVLKFEFNVIDTQNKAAALSTVQIDVENSKRFNIEYIDANGKKQYPLLLHCSISGSTERVIYGILEHQLKQMKKGKKAQFPLWLSPVQLRIIPVKPEFIETCLDTAKLLKKEGFRVEVDDRDISLNKRIRAAEKSWIPLIAVIGQKELELNKLNIRFRDGNNNQMMTFDEIVEYLHNKTSGKPQYQGSFPIQISKQPIFTRTV